MSTDKPTVSVTCADVHSGFIFGVEPEDDTDGASPLMQACAAAADRPELVVVGMAGREPEALPARDL